MDNKTASAVIVFVVEEVEIQLGCGEINLVEIDLYVQTSLDWLLARQRLEKIAR